MEPQSKPGLESLHQLHRFFLRLFTHKLQKFFDFQEIHYERTGGHKICPNGSIIFFQFVAEGATGLCVYVFQLEIMML